MEVLGPTRWERVGSVGEAGPPGSLSSDGPDRRRVIVFGWWKDQPGVWESALGIDVANEAIRAVTTTGLEQLSDLAEPFELNTSLRGKTMRVRFTLTEGE